LSGVAAQPRGRLWVLADSAALDAPMIARIAWNRRTGGVEFQDLGAVTEVKVRSRHTEVALAAGGKINLVQAPCVCGAGAVGNALPYEGRLSINNVSLYDRQGVVVL
jgi:hypothetical protein